jgi:predicted O-methyltransferase YrrM
VWFLENVLTAPSSTITCVDTFRGSDEHRGMAIDHDALLAAFRGNVVASFADRVRVLQGESQIVLRAMSPDPTFDLAYIDGSHRAPDVLADAVLCWPLVRPGGLLVFDDYAWRGKGSRPRVAIDAFLRVHAGAYELLHKRYQVAIRKAP